jgi:flavin-dependent dehydrogenase
VISESLVQNLAGEGILLPPEVIQRRIDSYVLHMDVGSVFIETPLHEKRIAAVHRGAGPRTFRPENARSFDAYLLGLARDLGARVVPEHVTGVEWSDGRPSVQTQSQRRETYDLVAAAVGVNAKALKRENEKSKPSYKPPRTTRAYISEFFLGRSILKRYIGGSMHVFLLDIPRLEFAAIIPKSDYVTACLLGEDVDGALAESFLSSAEVKSCMPPLWKPPRDRCRCSPRINIGAAPRPFEDRMVYIGDCATTRLYKDGIGAAYRTAKAAAVAAVLRGVSAETFRRYYAPACRSIEADNRIGKIIFALARRARKSRQLGRAVLRMVSREQQLAGARRRMSLVLWDVFTGSASYRSILRRMFHPAFLASFVVNVVAASRPSSHPRPQKGIPMTAKGTGVLGKRFEDGEIIVRQGEPGDCMYVVEKGTVEVLQREGDKEFCLTELGPGDFFGETAIFEGETRSTTVRAVGEAWVYSLQRDSLLRRIHEDPSLAFGLIQQMSYRIRELERALLSRASSASWPTTAGTG